MGSKANKIQLAEQKHLNTGNWAVTLKMSDHSLDLSSYGLSTPCSRLDWIEVYAYLVNSI